MEQYLVGAAILALIALIGCQGKGTAEKTGEQIDNVIDNVKHGDPPFKKKGALEKMGESIDDSLKIEEKK